MFGLSKTIGMEFPAKLDLLCESVAGRNSPSYPAVIAFRVIFI